MRRILTLLLPAMLACGARVTKDHATHGAAPGASSTTTPPDSAIYAALLASVYRGPVPDTIVLRDSSVVFADTPSTATVTTWGREFKEFPPELVARLLDVSRERRAATALALGNRPIQLLSRTRQTIGNPEEFWADFSRRSPGNGIIALSPVAVSQDGTQALVYYDYVCGPRCGDGGLKWLQITPNREWTVRKVLLFRMV